MASKIIKAVYLILSVDRPVTAVPVISETLEALEWLARNGYATAAPSRGFGPEYLKAARS